MKKLTLSLASLSFLCACSGGGGSQEPDPVVIDLPLMYIERPFPLDEEGSTVSDSFLTAQQFRPGASLWLKQRATATANARNISDTAFEEGAAYDVKDISPSPDGQKLVFSMRAPAIEDADEDEQPSWNLWQYDLEADSLSRIITSDIVAEQGEDVAPAYLPDGRVVFSSTRQRRSRAILLDDNKPQYAALDEDRRDPTFNLHVVSDDGETIEQITFNQSHDLAPTVLSNGRIAFSRWDNFGNNRVSWYSIDPYGFNLQRLYGHNSQNVGTEESSSLYGKAVLLEDQRLLSVLKPRDNNNYGGDLIAIDVNNFYEANLAVDNSEANAVESLTANDIPSNNSYSRFGRYTFATPFADGSDRLLVGWSQCRIIKQNGDLEVCTDSTEFEEGDTLAQPRYGLWILDTAEETQQPIILPEAELMISEAVTMEPRPTANFIPRPVAGIELDQELVNEEVGLISIRSVYDIDGEDTAPTGIANLSNPIQFDADDKPARFLRLLKAVSLPPRDIQRVPGFAFGRAGVMREILGYVPIEPDGSVVAKIPADVAVSFEIVDRLGHQISSSHRNWLQLRAGERLECNGCHRRNADIGHGRTEAEAASAYNGATVSGTGFSGNDPRFFADAGDTMAEVYERVEQARAPTVNLQFSDEWTDSTLATPAADIDVRFDQLATTAPVSQSCIDNWNALCRIVLNYPEHIQPVWDLPRQTFNDMDELITDNTCTRCHTPRDADGLFKDPNTYAQLDLRAEPSLDNSNQATSFRELLFNDIPQELIEGVVQDVTIEVPRLDDNGDPVFEEDSEGNLVQVFDTVVTDERIRAPLAARSARQNPAFFSTFSAEGSHAGYLSDAELFLISQWLELGAQYYNDPFAVPQQ